MTGQKKKGTGFLTAFLLALKKKNTPTAKPATPEPPQVFLGGRVSKKVLWISGLVLAVILGLMVSIIAGKGQHSTDQTDETETKSGNDGSQIGLDDILASAPKTEAVDAPDSTGNPDSSKTAPAQSTGATSNNNAEKEDPSVRQARQEAERERQRIADLKEQQFEAALASDGVVHVDLYSDATAGSTPDTGSTTTAKTRYEQALNDLKTNAALQGAAASTPSSPDQNKQDEKIAFSEKGHSNTYLTKGREMPLSTSELKTGTVIPATLISGINSDLPGQVIAQVNQNVYDSATHSQILLPQGAQLYGIYDSRVAYGQDRLLMAWTRVNFPDGTTLELGGMGGADAAGYAGFADQVDHHYFKIFGNAFILGMISGGMEAAVSDDNDDDSSSSESVSDGVVQQFGATGSSLIQKNLDVQPTITIRNGYKFNVMLNKDIVLPPYQPVN